MKTLAALVLFAGSALALSDPRFDSQDETDIPVLAAKASAAAIIDEDSRVWVELEAPGRAERQIAVDAGISIEEIKPGMAAGFATPWVLYPRDPSSARLREETHGLPRPIQR